MEVTGLGKVAHWRAIPDVGIAVSFVAVAVAMLLGALVKSESCAPPRTWRVDTP